MPGLAEGRGRKLLVREGVLVRFFFLKLRKIPVCSQGGEPVL